MRYWGKSRFYYLCLLTLYLFTTLPAQNQDGIAGRVFDAENGSPLAGASIVNVQTGTGIASGTKGEFVFNLSKGSVHIQVTYVGYQKLDTILHISGRSHVDFYLQPDVIQYEEVSITADKEEDYVGSIEMSKISMRRDDIKGLPGFMGESDPIRFLQLTPGVQSSTEGGIGFYVRGGGVDQNLVLYDHATIYNPGHLLGFVSVFNPDLVNSVSITKSGIPARHGGRLSSVIEVSPERGRSDSLRIMGQIGLVSSRVALSRSVLKERGSFVISARRASIDLFVKPLIVPLIKGSNPYVNGSSYNFYDFNGGFTYRIGKKDYISISGYYGRDHYMMNRESNLGNTTFHWGNAIISGIWTHSFTEKTILATSISHTSYDFDVAGSYSDYSFSMISDIQDYKWKSQLSWEKGKMHYSAGVELSRHAFTPNDVDVEVGGLDMQFLDFNKLYAYEGGAFLELEFPIGNRIGIAAGFRYSFFNQVGPYTEYVRDELTQVNDSILYPAGTSLAFYHHPEPRITAKYDLSEKASLKASYMHMAQYLHLATGAAISLPTDIWLPSSRSIPPQIGDQVSIGYFRSLASGMFESSVELYYKSSSNQVEFIRGILNNSVHMTMEENLALGKGRSYGAEFFLRKRKGTISGWFGYTLARSERQFDRLNDGKVYPAKNDRRHDISLATVWQINKLWSVSSVFIYVSGQAYTLPVGRYIIQGNLVNEYGEINNYRMPAYHRLDLSAKRSNLTRRGNISTWSFSIYNAYNRANPFYISFEATGNLEEYSIEVRPEYVSLFPIIPTISWQFEF